MMAGPGVRPSRACGRLRAQPGRELGDYGMAEFVDRKLVRTT
ncbi:hypothetical protein [Nocardiopsis sp. Huas11]|nr:hypothetical protein [Nocardiopsis sp. Huas11]